MLLNNYNRTSYLIKYKDIIGDLSDLQIITKPLGIIILLEIRGGIDKKKNGKGHRSDTISICNNIINNGWESFPIFYSDKTYNLVKDLLTNPIINGVIIRINPGIINGVTNELWRNLLINLNKQITIMSHPRLIEKMGSKDALVKIANLKGGRNDTKAYYSKKEWYIEFPKIFKKNPYSKRVIKQNRGSSGEGIWIVELKNKNIPVTNNSKLILLEAVDNHKEEKTLIEFMTYCEQYLDGPYGLIVNQKFLPRIIEGEIRFNLISDKVVSIVEKKPINGGISATLHSGAIYTSYEPDTIKFRPILNQLNEDLPNMIKSFNIENNQFPLIWTIDYIYDEKDINGNDTYCIGEINCTCVGIAKELNTMSPLLAKAAIKYCEEDRYN